ncbi:type III secretion system export apparatus subunit SctR [Chelatococcus sp. GCM10030263]|uniref:type III secretion system export apparatus subunit SctR n=1 Tax=Chelatococcus sp. GCM10030263 TaxID=3273387 RepID=UPI00362282F9
MQTLPENLTALIALSVVLGLAPLIVVTMTSFLKIAVVMSLLRNAIGVPQTPPNLIIYGVALVLTAYISMPVLSEIERRLSDQPPDFSSMAGLMDSAQAIKDPVKNHLMRFTTIGERQFFAAAAERIWPPEARIDVKDDDFIVLLPAFVSAELKRAFEIGFLLYLPFLVIDLVVANVLMAMGMMMVSPPLISVPLKLLLFISIDGWSRLLHGLILTAA